MWSLLEGDQKTGGVLAWRGRRASRDGSSLHSPKPSFHESVSWIKALPSLSAGKSVNLVNHLHQDSANSMSENHFKLGKFGILAYYYDSIFTFRFYRINSCKLNATLNPGQHGESVVTVLAVVFENASQNKMHLFDFQIKEVRIIYLYRGSNRLPSITFPRCLFWWSGTTKAWHVGHGCLNNISLLSTALQSKYRVLHRFT